MRAENRKENEQLPIEAVISEIGPALEAGRLVLVAPPGAGKTTLVPLYLLGQPWLEGRRIIVVEPRRLAARAAANRMAELLGEKVGARVGIRARLDTRASADTRIEVVTEGVFTRMILADPELAGVGVVIFDEFHERALDADFGLALALDCQAGLREDLKILVMSATLDGARVAGLLGGDNKQCRVIESEGRSFPVETHYLGRDRDRPLALRASDATMRALRTEEGDILVFLPGLADIERAFRDLSERLGAGESNSGGGSGDRFDRTVLHRLYGAVDREAQAAALRPSGPDERKVILATAIAETSLTIPGVRVVIDSGYARVPVFDAAQGQSRLRTVRASRANVDQRRGRAGRTAPGVCYRLWDEPETRALPAFPEPEVLQSDLSTLVLDCAEWGVSDPAQLRWLDVPPKGGWGRAVRDLVTAGALDEDGRLTALGRALRSMPMPPRLARGAIVAALSGRPGLARFACDVAVLITERGVGGQGGDLVERYRRYSRDNSARVRRLKDMSGRWAKLAAAAVSRLASQDADDVLDAAGLVRDPGTGLARQLAWVVLQAYPDRIAMFRSEGGPAKEEANGGASDLLMASGQGARTGEEAGLRVSRFLAVADLQGQASGSRVLLAVPLSREDVEFLAAGRIVRGRDVAYAVDAHAVRAIEAVRIGALVLEQQSLPRDNLSGADSERIAECLVEGVRDHAWHLLPWTAAQRQVLARVRFLRSTLAEDKGGDALEGACQSVDGEWPDLSDGTLRSNVHLWLQPFVAGCRSIKEISSDHLEQALGVLLPYEVRRSIDRQAPTHFSAPTGTRVPIDYEAADGPAVAIRVQELFGMSEHPVVGQERIPLLLKLLSPAQRPIQITRDLPGFWKGSWADVKAEMKGRYPKHVWPDRPEEAQPTRRAKPRS